MGKLLSNRVIGKNTIRATLIRGWKPSGSLSFKVLGDNLFLLDFEHEWDKLRVLEGRPWVFEGNLFSIEDFDGPTPPCQMEFETTTFWVRVYNLPLACMGKEVGSKLGGTVGVLEEVDIDVNGVGWGKYLRVRIKVNLQKLLA